MREQSARRGPGDKPHPSKFMSLSLTTPNLTTPTPGVPRMAAPSTSSSEVQLRRPRAVEYRELERRRVPDTKTLATEFDSLLRELAPVVARDRAARDRGMGDRLDAIEEIWIRAVGEEIAAHARPGRFRGGVLTVEVDSAPLAAELESFAREHLREALEREGLEGLCELKFRTGVPRR